MKMATFVFRRPFVWDISQWLRFDVSLVWVGRAGIEMNPGWLMASTGCFGHHCDPFFTHPSVIVMQHWSQPSMHQMPRVLHSCTLPSTSGYGHFLEVGRSRVETWFSTKFRMTSNQIEPLSFYMQILAIMECWKAPQKQSRNRKRTIKRTRKKWLTPFDSRNV